MRFNVKYGELLLGLQLLDDDGDAMVDEMWDTVQTGDWVSQDITPGK